MCIIAYLQLPACNALHSFHVTWPECILCPAHHLWFRHFTRQISASLEACVMVCHDNFADSLCFKRPQQLEEAHVLTSIKAFIHFSGIEATVSVTHWVIYHQAQNSPHTTMSLCSIYLPPQTFTFNPTYITQCHDHRRPNAVGRLCFLR